MSTATKESLRWLATVLAGVVSALALLWTASAIAQTPPPTAPSSPWLTPSAVYGGLTLLAGVVGWVIRWSYSQDEKIKGSATKEALAASEKETRSEMRASTKEIRDAVTDLGKIVQAAQSRDACALYRQTEASEIVDLGRGIDARMTVNERRTDRLLERLEGVVASARGLDDIKQMVSTLYQAGGFTPLPAPRPVGRQTTQPLPPIEPDREG